MPILRRLFGRRPPGPLTPERRLADARAAVARETRRARRRMLAERAARALWPLWTLIALFLGAAMLGLPQRLPPSWHAALLGAVAVAALALAIRAARAWRTPTDAEAAARLDAGRPERPVAALGDALTANVADPYGRTLWAAHQARMAERAAAARAPAPDLRVSAEDRFALRHAALLALAAGVIAQLADGGARLTDALNPLGGGAALAAAVGGPGMEAWASPPVHTRQPPLYLTERLGETIVLPVGSEIVLRVFDATEPPQLASDVGPSEGFVDQGGGAWSAAIRLKGSGDVSSTLRRASLGGWRFEATPDHPPFIAYATPPNGSRGGLLQFAFAASDDYGVAAARAEIALDAEAQPPFPGLAPASAIAPPAVELPLPLSGDARDVAADVAEDLTAHPWAGLPVTMDLVALDGAGQEARAPERLTLPARPFYNPLARALIEQRRHLAWSVDAAERVRDVLDAVTAYPEDVFEDASAYLLVRTARRRLGYAIDDARLFEETPGVLDLLWQAALKIEDGDLTTAERRLRDLQRELADAIERGASEDEIAQLMQELREALNEYLRQLAEQALRDMETGEAQPQDIDPNQMMTQQDLMDMLDQIEQALRNGMEDMAMQMLRQLQQLLENLQTAQPGQPQPGGGQGEQAMRELQDMIGRQQGLADRSFDALREGRRGQQGQGEQGQGQQGQGQQGQGQQQGRGGQPGETPGQGGQGRGDQFGEGRSGGGAPGLGELAEQQEALRRLLEQLRQGVPGGEAGEALERADRSMGSARDALEQGDADGALQDQVEALDALREGAQQLARQQNQPGQAQQAGRDGRAGNVRDEDPFGRPRATDGPLDGDSVRVPDVSAMRRARELMDEIRRRAGDRTRPPPELDYLERLLDRF